VAIQVGQSSRLLYGLMQHTWSICVLRGGDRIGPALHQEVCSKFGGGFVPGIADGGYWELLTSVFTHQQIWHIATNMFSLYVLGSQLEPGLGKARYLALYLLSGLSGSAMVYWVADPGTPTLGASGAIFGLLGAILIFFLKARQPLQQVLFLLVLNFAITFTVPGISWGAHVGGFLGGAAVGGVLAYTGGVRRRRLQLAGLVGVGVAIVIALAARTAVLG
jgi:membrane associated rhomboid family serine protease